MKNIEISRGQSLQKGNPDPVYIKLIGEDGNLRGFIEIYSKWTNNPETSPFRVEIHKGSTISPILDIRLEL